MIGQGGGGGASSRCSADRIISSISGPGIHAHQPDRIHRSWPLSPTFPPVPLVTLPVRPLHSFHPVNRQPPTDCLLLLRGPDSCGWSARQGDSPPSEFVTPALHQTHNDCPSFDALAESTESLTPETRGHPDSRSRQTHNSPISVSGVATGVRSVDTARYRRLDQSFRE